MHATPHPPEQYRLLLVSDSYAPLIGGADQSLQLLATELHKRGHHVSVVTAWQRGVPSSEVLDGVEVHRIRDTSSRLPWLSADPYKHHPPPFPDPEAVLRFRQVLALARPDLVHSYGWLTYSCLAALAHEPIPLVLSIRDWGNFCAVRTLLRGGDQPCSGPAPRKCLRCAGQLYGAGKGAVAVASILGGRMPLARNLTGAHFNSGYTRELAWEHLLRGRARFAPGSETEAVIPNFLPSADPEPPDEAILARLPPAPYILFVGAFRRVKGIGPLLDAYGRLSDPPPLVLIGTRESDSPATFPSGITVLESVPRATVLAAWDRALLGVFPSTVAETFGNAAHEAMARGTAVIGTKPGGLQDLIHDGETGLLVPRGDVEALAGAMRRLLADQPLRERLGAAAREHAHQFSAERMVPRFEALYGAAVRSSRQDAPEELRP